jgi:hypothetical protein
MSASRRECSYFGGLRQKHNWDLKGLILGAGHGYEIGNVELATFFFVLWGAEKKHFTTLYRALYLEIRALLASHVTFSQMEL